jgi:hypothetical protein
MGANAAQPRMRGWINRAPASIVLGLLMLPATAGVDAANFSLPSNEAPNDIFGTFEPFSEFVRHLARRLLPSRRPYMICSNSSRHVNELITIVEGGQKIMNGTGL